MSYYVHSSSLSYVDYLQALAFEKSFTTTIRTESRRIVASVDQLHADHAQSFNLMGGIAAELSSGFERLEVRLQRVGESIDEMRAEFHWGMCELLASMGRMNDSLDHLLRLSRTPAQTWATEQFAIACDAVRRGLHREALETLDRAIGGHGSNAGYRLDHRFHHLKGLVLLGSAANYDRTIVDHARAEAAFLDAHRYAMADMPREAAKNLVCAGWAAYVQGEVERASTHTKAGLTLDPTSPEAFFQLAKCEMHSGHPEAAEAPLKAACSMDPQYALKAPADGDFQRYQANTNRVLRSLRDEACATAEAVLHSAHEAVGGATATRCAGYALRELTSLDAVQMSVATAAKHLSSSTYHGALLAESESDRALDMVRQAVRSFVQAAQGRIETQLKDALARHENARSAIQGGKHMEVLIWFSFAFMILAMPISCSADGFDNTIGLFFAVFLGGTLLGTIPAFAVRMELAQEEQAASKAKQETEALKAQIDSFVPAELPQPRTHGHGRHGRDSSRNGRRIYSGRVTKTTPFGAFVEIEPGVEALLHISELAHERVMSTEDVLKVGDSVQVVELEVDANGRRRLSRKALL